LQAHSAPHPQCAPQLQAGWTASVAHPHWHSAGAQTPQLHALVAALVANRLVNFMVFSLVTSLKTSG
jgi:hypothetical protein